MKNLLIFNSPDHLLPTEYQELAKIQIENSFRLGWKKNDIILATNFNYKCMGIKSILVGDYFVFDKNRSTKIQVINELFQRKLIDDGQVYWFHDFDAFQLVPIDFELKNGKNAAFTTHGAYDPVMWNAGSFFFNKNACDIFAWIEEWMDKLKTNEQTALTHIWKINYNRVNKRCIILDSSYNLGIYNVDENINNSQLPIKVAHFHPHKKRHLDIFKNRNLLSNNFMAILEKYGIR